MKLQIVSDLHLEFYDMPLSVLNRLDFAPDLDFLALPGDIVVPCRQNGKIVQQVLAFLSTKARHVIYTTGNHEYYGGTREQAEVILKSYMPRNFVWLQNSDVTLDGVHFFGGTMWFPDQPLNQLYESTMSDFVVIKDFRKWVYAENTAFREAAMRLVTPQTVVLSHHLPHPRSTPQQFLGNSLNRFFLSDETSLIEVKQPRYWFHGHTHSDCNYLLGETEVICRPYGYPNERAAHGYPPYPPVIVEL
jgi:Icc-related predicted phosphoesterase